MTARIFLKLISAVLVIMVVALTAVDYLASGVAERAYIDTLTREMQAKVAMIEVLNDHALVDMSGESLHKLASAAGGRITVIGQDGRVLRDSEADPRRMENHGNRNEVRSALAGASGVSIRKSPTLGIDFLYVAIPSRPGAVRLAMPLSEVQSHIRDIRNKLLIYTGLAFLPAIGLAALFARSISSKLGRIIDYASNLAKGVFNRPLEVSGTDELGVLSKQLNETGQKLSAMFEALEREHAELEKVERVRKDFVINVSHELRTPLASIQGYTETLLDGALHDPDNNIRFLNIIRSNAERLGRLTADLLTLSRIELKSQRFHFASYNPKHLIEECVESIRPVAAKKAIDLGVTGEDNLAAHCDSEAVHQILSNLLDNAIKYTPGGGSVQVSLRPQGGRIEIIVADSGMGIPEEELPRLFERFYRVDKARSRELGGTGLGLAIVKHLVKAHEGEVSVSSQPGHGSTFRFDLPAASGADSSATPTPANTSTGISST